MQNVFVSLKKMLVSGCIIIHFCDKCFEKNDKYHLLYGNLFGTIFFLISPVKKTYQYCDGCIEIHVVFLSDFFTFTCI